MFSSIMWLISETIKFNYYVIVYCANVTETPKNEEATQKHNTVIELHNFRT